MEAEKYSIISIIAIINNTETVAPAATHLFAIAVVAIDDVVVYRFIYFGVYVSPTAAMFHAIHRANAYRCRCLVVFIMNVVELIVTCLLGLALALALFTSRLLR